MWDWVPIVLVVFKVGALAAAMFYAVKWHYDQGGKKSGREMIRTGVLMGISFLVLLALLGLFAYSLAAMLGLDLRLP